MTVRITQLDGKLPNLALMAFHISIAATNGMLDRFRNGERVAPWYLREVRHLLDRVLTLGRRENDQRPVDLVSGR